MKKKKGFTLSEVLITLAIIGVVAAFTIPVVSENGQKIAFKTALKKNHLTLERALKKFELENGFRLKPDYIGHQGLKAILMPYLDVMVDCSMGAGVEDEEACVKNPYNDPTADRQKIYKAKEGETLAINKFDDGQFILTDGTMVFIENERAIGDIFISVDVNGMANKPNRLGKDLFMFQLMDYGKLLPMGAEGTKYPSAEYCGARGSGEPNYGRSLNGAGCTIEMLKD